MLSRIGGVEPAAIDQAFVGSCVSLGRAAGLRQFARKDDTALTLYFGGRLGAAYKELTYRLGVGKIRKEAREPGSVIWLKGGRRAAAPPVTTP
nr:hypothetical protein GCM10017745_34460 [Saccharothrix mutabilis subsp. capreolus]